jgi:uncharacterized protein YdcH (DUF465 family)
MEMNLQEVKDRLMAHNEEFSRLAKEHSEYEHQLEELARRPYLTEAEQLLETNIKKKKLSLKDQMERLIQQYKRGAVTH